MSSTRREELDRRFRTVTSLVARGEIEPAVKQLYQLIDEFPEDVAVLSWYLGSVLYSECGDPAAALPFLRRAVRERPLSEKSSIEFFHVLSDLGRDEEAYAELERFWRASPDTPRYRLLLRENGYESPGQPSTLDNAPPGRVVQCALIYETLPLDVEQRIARAVGVAADWVGVQTITGTGSADTGPEEAGSSHARALVLRRWLFDVERLVEIRLYDELSLVTITCEEDIVRNPSAGSREQRRERLRAFGQLCLVVASHAPPTYCHLFSACLRPDELTAQSARRIGLDLYTEASLLPEAFDELFEWYLKVYHKSQDVEGPSGPP